MKWQKGSGFGPTVALRSRDERRRRESEISEITRTFDSDTVNK
jgi:hypothetical protein